jgi:hypothetical protein
VVTVHDRDAGRAVPNASVRLQHLARLILKVRLPSERSEDHLPRVGAVVLAVVVIGAVAWRDHLHRHDARPNSLQYESNLKLVVAR